MWCNSAATREVAKYPMEADKPRHRTDRRSTPWRRRVRRGGLAWLAGGLLSAGAAVVVLVTVVTSAVGGPPQPGARLLASAAFRASAQEGYNTAWSGWIDVADPHVAFRSVSATFTVPAVTCTVPGAAVALWAGLDGYPHGNPTIEQVGVAANCVQNILNGVYPIYFAWYQMGPDGPVREHTVNAGDTVSVSVDDSTGTGRYRLTLTDREDQRADFRISARCPAAATCHNSSAEVIAEDPGGGYAYRNALANFGLADFSDIAVSSANGTVGSLQSNSRWQLQAEAMVNDAADIVAEPSQPADRATAFSVTYTPDLVLLARCPGSAPRWQPVPASLRAVPFRLFL